MKKQLAEAFYSLKTGKRTTNTFGKRNPEKVLAVNIDSNFLRGKQIAITDDGMPANLEAAKLAVAAWDTHQAKLEARRTAAKAKKAAAAVKTVGKKTAKKTSRLVKRDREDGQFAKRTSRKKSVVTDIVKAPQPLMKAPLRKVAKKAPAKKPKSLM